MRKGAFFGHAAFGLMLFMTQPVMGYVEENYDPGQPRAVTPWYGYVDPAALRATKEFIDGMRPHHAGALTMAEEYLADPQAQHVLLRQLARGIIHNQEFEIGMLDRVEAHMRDAQGSAPGWQRIATEGLVQQQRFFRAPVPGPLDGWAGARVASRRDVQFAKAMIVHHEGALIMARDYLRDPHGRNGYLQQMCLAILLDQQNEINLMERIIADYPGNPDEVEIDASMIHGMEGMDHGVMDHDYLSHGGHHH